MRIQLKVKRFVENDEIGVVGYFRVAGIVHYPDGTFQSGQTCEAPNREQAIGLWLVTNEKLVGLKLELV